MLSIKKTLIIIGVLAVVDVFATFIMPVFDLDETQIMYFLSTIPQVVAAFAGLTVAGYAIVESVFKQREIDEEGTTSAHYEVRMYLRKSLIAIMIFAAFDIIICFLGLCAYSHLLGHSDWWYRLILNSGGLFLLFVLFLIICFVWNISDPNLIQRVSNSTVRKMNKKFEARYEHNESGSNYLHDNNIDELRHDVSGGDKLAAFLTSFNCLEKSITTIAHDAGFKKRGLMAAINYLRDKGWFTIEQYKDLTELVKYRNNLVHGTDFEVNDKAIKLVNDVALNTIGALRIKLNQSQ